MQEEANCPQADPFPQEESKVIQQQRKLSAQQVEELQDGLQCDKGGKKYSFDKARGGFLLSSKNAFE